MGVSLKGSLDAPPIVLRAGPIRGAALAVIGIGLGLLLLSLAVGFHIDDPSIAVGVLILSLIGALGVVMLVRPTTLTIDRDGLTLRVLGRTRRYAWVDVHDFRAMRIGLVSKLVGFSFVNQAARGATTRQFNAAMTGVEATLSPGLEMKCEALADLLNEARERWLYGAAPGTAGAAGMVAAAPPAPSAGQRPRSVIAAGRMNRKVYWIVVGALFGASFLIGLIPGVNGLGIFGLVLLIRVYAVRLHDIGRSGWWQLVMFAVMIAAGVAGGVLTGGGSEVAIEGGASLVQLALTVALGAIPGQPAANRFGPPPGQMTPARASETFR